MKQITFVAHGPSQINGPNIWLQRMLPELLKRDFHFRVIFLMHSNEPCAVVNNLEAQGIPCTVLPFQRYTELNMVAILNALRQDPPDIFIPNLSVPAYFAARWIQQAGIPTIGIMHSDDNFYHDLINTFVFGAREDRLSGLVCVSEYLTRSVKERKPTIKIFESPYGVHLPAQIATYNHHELKVIYTGRLIQQQKRIFDVIQAFAMAVSSIAGISATVFGDDREGGRAIAAIAEVGLGDRLTYGGVIPYQEIYSTLADYHILALLSDYEGISISLMEVMACGVVPICTKTRSGAMQIIKHNINGLLVENREDDFVKAVKRLKDEEGLWERLSKAARHTIEQQYALGMQANRWSDFLNSLPATPFPQQQIVVPRLHEIHLPVVGKTEYGMSREDRRMLAWMCLPVIKTLLQNDRLRRYFRKGTVLNRLYHRARNFFIL